ncbi:hypothetical protein [Photobacterium sp. 1_MG-2023]|uniref:hypothetical protein n=1 Tax=Photobacterium sp. 1_MG-2023 TaxID=3062646 RepID=UPI0026E390EC|nr:hypothetical protein [Photobacterium sp. 1_MG-2023]MDO6706766.1 hypothetical protein [Photobacterium sp. 1_MG-2023]
MNLSLFALTNDPSKRIVKFELSKDVQNDLSGYINSQEKDFDSAIDEVEFDGKYKPDDGEVLYISDFDDIDGLTSTIENPLGVDVVDPTEDFFIEIKALFTGYTTDSGSVKVLLQNFDRRKIISTNGLSIFHSSNVYKKIEGIGLTLDHKLTATLEEGKLKFFSFHNARQMFDLSQHYKVATDDDVKDFAALPMVKTESTSHLIEMSDSWVRRKISLIQQSGILQVVPISEMKTVANEFHIPFFTEIDGGVEVIKLPDNKSDLKRLLRFLDEDYYKSPLSNTAFVTNSKRAMTNP